MQIGDRQEYFVLRDVDLEWFVSWAYGRSFSFVYDQNPDRNSAHEFYVDGDPELRQIEGVEAFKKGHYPRNLTHSLLQYACSEGVIPQGMYLVRHYW